MPVPNIAFVASKKSKIKLKMNEYLKKIYDDAKKHMPRGVNGAMWTSGTWSENHVMTEVEKLNWDNWLNGVLISNQSRDFNQNLFEDEVLVFRRELPKKEYFSSFFLYLDGETFDLEPRELNSIVNKACLQTNKPQLGIWFYGSQNDAYHYTIHGFGMYTLKSLKTETEFVNYEATLAPLFANIVNTNKHQVLENNYETISGIVGVNKDWVILLMWQKENEVKITINGDKEFCELIRKELETSR